MEELNEQRELNKYIHYFFRLIFSLILIGIALYAVDSKKTLYYITNFHSVFFFLAYLSILLGALPSAFAWKIILKSQQINFSLLYLTYLNIVGFFFNSFLPTGIGGDVWRAVITAKNSKQTNKSSIALITERITAFCSIIIIGLASLIINHNLLKDLKITGKLTVVITGLFFVFVFGILITPYLLKKSKNILSKLFPSIPPDYIIEIILLYWKKPYILISPILFSLISPILECIAYVLILKALRIEVALLPIAMIVPVLRFINHIPISINSIGTQDITLLLFWQSMGLSGACALSISFMMHILRLMVSITGGILYIVIPNIIKPVKKES